MGGALIHHALNDSDSSSDEEGHKRYNAPPQTVVYEQTTIYQQQPAYQQEPAYHTDSYYGGGPPAVLPPTDADGHSVSSSDRESVQEARENYEEALAKANDSDASSSDYEELAEAREEYEEEYEETYED